MKRNKKLFPFWLLIVIDLSVIAAYTAGFYLLYYRTPRQLKSSGIKTEQNITDTSRQDKKDTSGNGGRQKKPGKRNMEETELTKDFASNRDETSENQVVENKNRNLDLGKKYADHFTDTVVTTENSYTSPNIAIKIDQYTQGSGGNMVTYYVADIYLADITCLQSGFAKNTYGIGYADDLLNMDKDFGAILAINGDYYGNGDSGVVIRNGEVYRKENGDSDVCVLFYDGTMKTYAANEFDADTVIKEGVYQAWSFGPELLDENGNSMTDFNTSSRIKDVNPRTALGYYEPGHYAFVVVDGRQRGYSIGITLSDLSKLFEKLGCSAAYNLDGGKSSAMTFADGLINNPVGGGREVSDCVFIKEVTE